MPVRLNLGLTKKVGLPDYGSLGAACHVELDLDGSLLDADLEGFHRQVRRAYVACRQAVEDELARQQGAAPQAQHGEEFHHNGSNRYATKGLKRQTGNVAAKRATSNGHRATSKQLDYARQLADQIDGLGLRKLGSLTDKLYQKPLADLSSLEASGLIDVLKDIKSGELDLAEALAGAAV